MIARNGLPPLSLGLGCDRGTPLATLNQLVHDALTLLGFDVQQVVALASIDLKADEPGLLALGQLLGLPLRCYGAPELARVPVPHPSATVLRYTGTPSVAEAAALLAAGYPAARLLLEKHRLRGPDGRNATLSIATPCPDSLPTLQGQHDLDSLPLA